MLSKDEIEKLIHKKGMVMADRQVLKESESWEQTNRRFIRPGMIAAVYTYLKTEYEDSETLEQIQDFLGFDAELISYAIQLLEEHGYVTVSRSTKPFRYAVVK